MFGLTVCGPGRPSQTRTFQTDLITIGRHSSNDLVISDPQVSKHHAAIFQAESGSYIIRDLSSRNNTWVNGRAGPRHILSPGDEITIGPASLIFAEAGKVAPPVAAAPQVLFSGENDGSTGKIPLIFTPEMGACEDKSRLQQLYDIATTLTASLEMKVVLQNILNKVVENLPAERAFLALQEEPGGALRILSTYSASGLPLEPINISHSIITKVTEEGKAILLPNALDDPRFRKAKSVVRYQLRSVACVPLRSGDKIIGVLYADNRSQPGTFASTDVPFLVAVGQLAAIALSNAQIYQEVREREHRLARELRHRHQILACSTIMQQIKKMITQVAATAVPVLILGESGTGKELVAREIHAQSPRAGGPFLAVNCASIAESLAESELFGVCRGVATGVSERPGLFEQAQDGTIFLDEIGEMAPGQQAKMLRVLEERLVARVGATRRCACRDKPPGGDHTRIHLNVRIIAATNKDLECLMKEQGFRTDLFYRLNVFPIKIPPLRERPEDIPLLATFIFDEECQKLGKDVSEISYQAMKRLRNLRWQGSNVRQLRSELQRAIILSNGNMLQPADFQREQEDESSAALPGKTLKEAMRHHILKVLEECRGNKTRAATILNISPGTLYNRLHEYGLEEDKSSKNEEWSSTT